MIQAKELRIGNYVWENYGGYYIVRGIPGNGKDITISKTQKTIAVNFDIRLIKPIPLTEDILLRCGFVSGVEGELQKHINYTCGISYFDDKVNIVVDGEDCWLPKIQYLHQLQNLFYSLTGEELLLQP